MNEGPQWLLDNGSTGPSWEDLVESTDHTPHPETLPILHRKKPRGGKLFNLID